MRGRTPLGAAREGWYGGVMKSLRKQQGNVRRRGFSGARLCRFGGRWEAGLGLWAGDSGGPALGWAGPAPWPVDARGEDLGSGAAEAETLGLKF